MTQRFRWFDGCGRTRRTLDVAADGIDPGHAWHALDLRVHDPVLHRAQIGGARVAYTARLCSCFDPSRCASKAAATLRTRKRELSLTASECPSSATTPSEINGT